jgi:hypothetical protein
MLRNRHIIILCLFVLFAFSCNNSTNTAEKSTEVSANLTINTPESIKDIENMPPQAARDKGELDKKLAECFTNEQITQLKNVEKSFNAIQTAEDLAKFYRQTLPEVIALVNKKLNQYDPENVSSATQFAEKWAWFNDYMPYLTVELFCSECKEENYFVINALRDKAELTSSKEDDMFFDALLITYRDANNKDKVCDKKPNNWVKLVNCDLCGADILGSEKFFNTLTAVEKAQKAGKLFDAELNELSRQALPQAATNYYLPKETVLKELENIIGLTSLSAKNKENLKNMRYLINIGKDMQFDCQSGNCQFLAM